MDSEIQKSVIAIWDKIGIPKSYISTKESEYVTGGSKDLPLLHKTVQALQGWAPTEVGWMMYLYGAPNTQKTSWAALLVKRLLKSNIEIRYIGMSNLFDLRKGGSTLTTTSYQDKAKLTALQAVPILIIDDAFNIKTTFVSSKGNFIQSFIYNFLRWRIENGLITIIISQNVISDISSKFGGENLRHLIKDTSVTHKFTNEVPRSIRYKKILGQFT